MGKISQLVINHRDEIEALAKENDVRGLYNFAIRHGLDSRSGFYHYKKSLFMDLDINYDEIRGGGTPDKIEDLKERVTHHITLYSDGYDKGQRFGVTNRTGVPVWYGRLFHESKNQADAEMQAAKNAVYLASRFASENKLYVIGLTLCVDAEWLCYANYVFNPEPSRGNRYGGKARRLGLDALKKGVLLDVVHVYSQENPADAPSRGIGAWKGYCRWNENLDKISFDEPKS